MRTKMALAVLAASTLAAGNMSAFGGVLKSESTPATSEVQTEEASGAEDVGRILRTFKIKKNVEVTDNGKIII